MSDAAIVAIVTGVAGVIAGFFKFMDNQNKTHEKLARSIDTMAKASEKVAAATNKQASATNKQAKEAEIRNGHLAEISVQQGDRIIAHMENIREQHVNKQIVDEQKVKTEIVENKK